MPETSHPPVYSFTYDPSSLPFTASPEQYMAKHPSAEYQYFATGALVFDDSNSSTPCILLIQRSASDSMPGRWEIPGGGVDDEDEYPARRRAELWEEAALTAVSIGPLVGNPRFFENRSGKRICKFHFLVEAKSAEGAMDVKLNRRSIRDLFGLVKRRRGLGRWGSGAAIYYDAYGGSCA